MNVETLVNDQEKKEIQKFLKNDAMREAVKKILLCEVYEAGTLKEGEAANSMENFAFALCMSESGGDYVQDNERIGERLRACCEGIRFIETGFIRLNKFKEEPKAVKDKKNPAR